MERVDKVQPDPHRAGYVAVVGPASAGKSTLVNALVGDKVSIVSAKPQTTRNRILGIKTVEEAQAVFVDTPGFIKGRRRGELARFLKRSLKEGAADVDVTLLVLDGAALIKRPERVDELHELYYANELARPDIIAINKIDLIERPELLPLMNRVYTKFISEAGTAAEIFPLSALQGDGVSQLWQLILGRLGEGPAFFPDDITSDQQERFLAAEVIREKLFHTLEQELPYSIAVVVEKWEEEREPELLKIYAAIFVERTSQKAIVIGKGGSKLKQVGTAARLELEQLLGVHVFLELFVKVEPNWTRTKGGMSKAGYIDTPGG